MRQNYFLLIILFILASNVAFSQKEPKEKKVKSKKEKTEQVVVEKRNLTFTKPKNAWQVGIFGGASTLFGDVTPNLFYGNKPALPGHNFGLFVSKSWSYLVSTRLRYSTSVMFTSDAVASTLTENQYLATNRNNDIGLRPYTPGQTIFHNSRTQGHDINFDLVFTLGNINYHKERSPMVFRFFPTVGMYMYQTFYDQLDANDNAYDYSSVVNLNELGKTDRKEVLDALNTMRDGKYETRAEEHSVFDENKLIGYNPRFTFGLGTGIAIRLTKFMSLDLETRQTFVNDDLIDGMQWQEPGDLTTKSRNRTINLDTYNQTTLGLTFSFVSKKVGEPLCMQNPLWGADIYDKKSKTEDEPEEVDSTNILLSEKVDNLEDQIDNLEFLIKMLAKKKEQEQEAADAEGGNNGTGETDGTELVSAEDYENYDYENNPDNLTEEQLRLKKEAEALRRKGGTDDTNEGSINDLDDKSFRLRDGEYMYIGDLQGDIHANYYLIAGSFKVKSNAKKDQKEWTEKGIETHLMVEVRSALYRVVIDYTDDHDAALDLLDEYRDKVLKSIWLIKAK